MVHTSGTIDEHSHRLLKETTFSPAQPRQLFHPPALSLPRHSLHPGTCRCSTGKAVGSEGP